MIQTAIVTKWKFVVEFEDEETKEISGTLGETETAEECEGLIEYDVQDHTSRGRTVINAEAVEICAQCEGEGKIPAGNGELAICDACGGHHGPISRWAFPRLLERDFDRSAQANSRWISSVQEPASQSYGSLGHQPLAVCSSVS
jgi:hypothetical protein